MNRRHDERGFTLPELLLAVVILGTIIGVIADGLGTAFRVTQDADRRIAESADGQFLAAWFPGDVQSAVGGVTRGASSCAVAGDDVVLGMAWTDGSTARAVAYVLVAGEDGARSLVRRTCTGGPPPARSHTLARYVQDGARDAVAGVTCVPATCSATGTTPLKVTLAVTDVDGRTQRVTATRRTNG